MATTKEQKTCTLKIKYIKEEHYVTKDEYGFYTYNHVNPEVPDGDFYEIAILLADLQTHSVDSFIRSDNAYLVTTAA